jgi:hypothetical protein
MAAGAQATATAVDRQVEAAPDGSKLTDFPPWLMDHACISDDRCGALGGGSSGGVLLMDYIPGWSFVTQ